MKLIAIETPPVLYRVRAFTEWNGHRQCLCTGISTMTDAMYQSLLRSLERMRKQTIKTGIPFRAWMLATKLTDAEAMALLAGQ